MGLAVVVLSVVLALAAAISAVGKLTKADQVMKIMSHVGVPAGRVPVLAVLELLGAAGLLIGLAVPVLGLLAALGLVGYFVGAVIAHLRVSDQVSEYAPAAGLAVLSIVTAVVRALTL